MRLEVRKRINTAQNRHKIKGGSKKGCRCERCKVKGERISKGLRKYHFEDRSKVAIYEDDIEPLDRTLRWLRVNFGIEVYQSFLSEKFTQRFPYVAEI